jgi:hypothetical protein
MLLPLTVATTFDSLMNSNGSIIILGVEVLARTSSPPFLLIFRSWPGLTSANSMSTSEVLREFSDAMMLSVLSLLAAVTSGLKPVPSW